jgi:hypothetical protein
VCTGGRLDKVYWRGGTDTGPEPNCSPNNDVQSWWLVNIVVIRQHNGTVQWSYSPSPNPRYNCDVHDVSFSRSPSLNMDVDHHIYVNFKHNTTGPSFYPAVGFYLDL